MIHRFTSTRDGAPRPAQALRSRPCLTPETRPTRRLAGRATRKTAASGFTLIEATLSVLLVGVTLAAALQAAAASNLTQYKASQRATARFLAQGLMSEILALDYQNPGATPLFGREVAELVAPNRATYNDVDDYAAYTESPPTDRDGNVMPNWVNWSRSVAVAWVSPTSVNTTSITETGVKRITVTVRCSGNILATLTAVKTNAP